MFLEEYGCVQYIDFLAFPGFIEQINILLACYTQLFHLTSTVWLEKAHLL